MIIKTPSINARILLADDESALLLSMRRILEREGWEVDTARDSDEALRHLEQTEYDLALVDYKMPGNEDLEMVREVHEQYSDLPVIVFTGYPSVHSAVQSYHLNVVDYLQKPLDLDYLRRRILEILNIQRQAKALEESEARYRLVTEFSSTAIYWIDEDQNYRFLSNNFLDMTGYRPEDLRQSGGFFEHLIHPEDLGAWRAHLEVALQHGYHSPLDVRIVTRNGEVRWMAHTCRIVRDSDHKRMGVRGSFLDITNLKRTEGQLRRAEAYSRDLLHAMPDQIFRISPEGVYLDSHGRQGVCIENARACIGRRIEDMLPAPVATQYHEAIGRALQEHKTETLEYRLDREEGRCFFEARLLPRENGEVLAIVRDVTRQKEAERALRENEAKYHLFVEQTDEGIFRVDFAQPVSLEQSPAQRIIDIFENAVVAECNKPAARVLGREADALPLGEKLVDVIDCQDIRFKDVLLVFLESDYQVKNYEIIVSQRDGHRSYFRFNLLGHVEKGHLQHVWGSLQDVTNMHHLEEQRRRAARIEATVTMAAGIAHDFNNLLTCVLGNVEMLLDDMEDEDGREMLTQAYRAAEKAGHLSQQMQTFAEGHARKREESILLNPLVRDVVKLYGDLWRNREIKISAALQPKAWSIEGDAEQIRQALAKMLDNAREAIDDRGTIWIETRNLSSDKPFYPVQRLHGSTEVFPLEKSPLLDAGQYVELAVEDNGIGMDDATTTRVFEPFYTKKFLGRGLGLSVVHGIARIHEAELGVYSQPGEGTRFALYFPADKPLASAYATRGRGHKPRGTETLLLIDDEEGLLSITQRQLEKLGYKTLTAKNGKEALGIVRTYPETIHMALLDVGMPVMDGPTAFPLLKSERPEMKILVNSGFAPDQNVEDMLDKGAAGFVKKPFAFRLLTQRIREILDA